MATARHHKVSDLGKHFISAIERFGEDDMTTYAAAIAYQLFFSLFSFVIFFISLLGILQIPDFFDQLVDQAQTALPMQGTWIVKQVITQIRELSSIGVLSFGAVATLWAASAGVRALMHALNAAYRIGQGRQSWKRYPISILYAILLIIMIVVVVGLLVVSSPEMRWISDQIHVNTVFVTW